VIEQLYAGFQCSSCGQRFTPGETEQYREHLDWHFRQNKKEKDVSKVTKYRTWYFSYLVSALFVSRWIVHSNVVSTQDWIQYEEYTSKEDLKHSEVFDKMASNNETASAGAFPGSAQNERLSCPAASGDDNDDVRS
jgi:pre-mRNA cleavage complex 2 protein Pcf11